MLVRFVFAQNQPNCGPRFPDRIDTPSKEMWHSLDYQVVDFGRGQKLLR